MTDPDPRGPKTYGSGPPVLWSGSGSVSFWASRIRIRHYLYRSFHPQAKKVYKTLISALLWLFKDFLSLKTDANVASKNNKQKKLEKKLIFGWLASQKATDDKSRIRIRIRKSWVRIRGSGSVLKCHGSKTLGTTLHVIDKQQICRYQQYLRYQFTKIYLAELKFSRKFL